MTVLEPANVAIAGIPAPRVALAILILALLLFTYIMTRRIELLRKLMPDLRFNEIAERLKLAIIYGFGQYRQPRYLGAGILHILLFAGFVLLALRSLTLIGKGFSAGFHLPFMTGYVGLTYEVIKDYAVLIVLIVCVIAIIRRVVFKPARYSHGSVGGHEHEAYVILGMVALLMITDMLYDGTAIRLSDDPNMLMFPAAASASYMLGNLDGAALNKLHISAYWTHIVVFFSLLNYLPMSKHFHVITAIPNVFFAKLNKGGVKPVRYGVDDWMALEGCGVGKFEDFTWKHALDFYSCADCGRCSDNCPANIVGRSLSPRMISIKARDYAYRHYPVFSDPPKSNGKEFVGDIITDKEIWACTTCGACEQECPIFIEYIDKIVDMRRYLLDRGELPQSLQKPMQQIKKKGNAYGGARQKRAAWTKDLEEIEVRELKSGDSADYIFFVDGCGSYDPRIQEITKSFVRILDKASIDFGILGQNETDSGNEVRRLGEEGLFEQVSEKNIAAFQSLDFKELLTFDPHAYNTIKNDYPVKFPVTHSVQLMDKLIQSGKLSLSGDYLNRRIVTFQDPCYLGRHNNIYNEPRSILRSIPGMKFRDMERSRTRSFCCSGGGLLLWYENEEENIRMGELRVKMAQEIGAEMIVTACPFCLINIEDAVKTTGNEGKIEVIDIVELVARSMNL